MTDEKKPEKAKKKDKAGPGPESQVTHHRWVPKKD